MSHSDEREAVSHLLDEVRSISAGISAMSQSDDREAVGRLLEHMQIISADNNSLRNELAIFRVEQVELRAAVITLQDGQERLRVKVATLNASGQDSRDVTTGRDVNEEQLWNETQTQSDMTRFALIQPSDSTLAGAAKDDNLRDNVTNLHENVQELRGQFSKLSEQTQKASDILQRDLATMESRIDDAIGILKTRVHALDTDRAWWR